MKQTYQPKKRHRAKEHGSAPGCERPVAAASWQPVALAAESG
jgi:hypothetical protein